MIRSARPDDAAALAGVQHRAWHRAYVDDVDPELFGTLDERVERWRQHLAHPERTLVFDQDGVVAGFASLAEGGAGTGELRALYVDPPAQGAGVGGALLDAAVERLRAAGNAVAVLWVFAANEHARHVYEQRGWTLDPGSTREDRWAPEVRYRREL